MAKEGISRVISLVISMLFIRVLSDIFKSKIVRLHGSSGISKGDLKEYAFKVDEENSKFTRFLLIFRNYLATELAQNKGSYFETLSVEEYFCLKTLKELRFLRL